MTVIRKYPILREDCFTLELPYYAQVLCVQHRAGVPYLWVAIDASMSLKKYRSFALLYDDTPTEFSKESYVYVGTYQDTDATVHLFEFTAKAKTSSSVERGFGGTGHYS